jgi:hypothetical protein
MPPFLLASWLQDQAFHTLVFPPSLYRQALRYIAYKTGINGKTLH